MMSETQIDPRVVQMMATATQAGLRVLGARLLAFLALSMTFGLFCWAMWAHEWIAFATAATFNVLTFIPALVLSRLRGESHA